MNPILYGQVTLGRKAVTPFLNFYFKFITILSISLLMSPVFAILAVTMASEPLYKDATQPIPVRASNLLTLMTLEEKVAQLLQPWETKSPAQVHNIEPLSSVQ